MLKIADYSGILAQSEIMFMKTDIVNVCLVSTQSFPVILTLKLKSTAILLQPLFRHGNRQTLMKQMNMDLNYHILLRYVF